MSTNLQYLVHFIQYRVSEIVITIPKVQSAIINSGNLNKRLWSEMRIHLCPPEEFSTQGLPAQGAPATRVK
jgi:hypothetical protein